MALDHYIPRCLTRPWRSPRFGHESLRVVDLDTLTCETRNDKKLFARRRLNKPETEQFLQRYIEDPFAHAQDALLAAMSKEAEALTAAFASLPATAMVGLFWLQVQRIKDATEPRTEHHMNEVAARGVSWLEGFSAAVFHKFEPQLVVVPQHLYFPSSAFFTVPMIGEMPVFAMPLTTALALVFAPRDGDDAQLEHFVLQPAMMTACSIGIGPLSRLVVIPPEIDPEPTPTRVQWLRGKVHDLFGLYAEMQETAGIPTWILNA